MIFWNAYTNNLNQNSRVTVKKYNNIDGRYQMLRKAQDLFLLTLTKTLLDTYQLTFFIIS